MKSMDKDTKRKPIKRECNWCGTFYVMNTSFHKYCSSKCQKKASRQETKEIIKNFGSMKTYHKTMELDTRTCLYCKNEFVPKAYFHVYCCKECSQKKNNLKMKIKRNENRKKKTCLYCGDQFDPVRTDQKYCSHYVF